MPSTFCYPAGQIPGDHPRRVYAWSPAIIASGSGTPPPTNPIAAGNGRPHRLAGIRHPPRARAIVDTRPVQGATEASGGALRPWHRQRRPSRYPNRDDEVHHDHELNKCKVRVAVSVTHGSLMGMSCPHASKRQHDLCHETKSPPHDTFHPIFFHESCSNVMGILVFRPKNSLDNLGPLGYASPLKKARSSWPEADLSDQDITVACRRGNPSGPARPGSHWPHRGRAVPPFRAVSPRNLTMIFQTRRSAVSQDSRPGEGKGGMVQNTSAGTCPAATT